MASVRTANDDAMDLAHVFALHHFITMEREAALSVVDANTLDELFDENAFTNVEYIVLRGLYLATGNDPKAVEATFAYIRELSSNAIAYSAYENKLPAEFVTETIEYIEKRFRTDYAEIAQSKSILLPAGMSLAAAIFKTDGNGTILIGAGEGWHPASSAKWTIGLAVIVLTVGAVAWFVLEGFQLNACAHAKTSGMDLFLNIFGNAGQGLLLALGDIQKKKALTTSIALARGVAAGAQCDAGAVANAARTAQSIISNKDIIRLLLVNIALGGPSLYTFKAWLTGAFEKEPEIERRDRRRVDRFKRSRKPKQLTLECSICQSPALHTCGACDSGAYCSADCQTLDWDKGHSETCCNT